MAELRGSRDGWRTDINQRLLDSNPRLWARILESDYRVRSAAKWSREVLDAHASHPCDRNCEPWMPEPAEIQKCVNYMDAFFHVCENVDVARANHLAAIALMFLNQNILGNDKKMKTMKMTQNVQAFVGECV